ncbi:hypothetical protein D3C86_2248040 [compost metagenome]
MHLQFTRRVHHEEVGGIEGVVRQAQLHPFEAVPEHLASGETTGQQAVVLGLGLVHRPLFESPERLVLAQ